MAVLPSPRSTHKFYAADGVTPLSGGKVATYAAGTTTPLASFSNADGTAANTNPITLNSNGEAAIYLTAGVAYDIVPMLPDGVTPVGPTQRVIVDGDTALRSDLSSSLTGKGASLLGWPTGYAVNQLGTGQHFGQNGAAIHRFNDRLFLSAATANDGLFPNVAKDWSSTEWVAGGFSSGPMVSSILGIANNSNPNNAIGVFAAVRTKDFSAVGTASLPVFGVAWNDNATLATKAWGGYFEGHRTTATAGATYGLEIDTRTLTASVTPTPWLQGDIVGLQIASGAEWSATGQFDASVGIQFASNPKKFRVGINFMNDSLVDLGSGIKEAIALPTGSLIRSYHSGGSSSFIYFAPTTTNGTPSALFADTSFNITETSSGNTMFRVNTATSRVNFPVVTPSATTVAVEYGVNGTDANIDLQLTPKGTGNVRFGTYTSTGDVTCNGYITIKDAGGTTRKLMTTA